jgi:hypothetical protein
MPRYIAQLKPIRAKTHSPHSRTQLTSQALRVEGIGISTAEDRHVLVFGIFGPPAFASSRYTRVAAFGFVVPPALASSRHTRVDSINKTKE